MIEFDSLTSTHRTAEICIELEVLSYKQRLVETLCFQEQRILLTHNELEMVFISVRLKNGTKEETFAFIYSLLVDLHFSPFRRDKSGLRSPE